MINATFASSGHRMGPRWVIAEKGYFMDYTCREFA
jgi:hypothetical protein